MPQDFDLDQFKTTYFEECQELLDSAEEQLGALQNNVDDVDVEVLHAIFRCVHSIKGGAGAFNFTELVKFSHIFETLLGRLRENEITLTLAMAETLLNATDVLSLLVQAAQNDEVVEPSMWQRVAESLEFYTQEDEIGLSENIPEPDVATPKNKNYSKTAEEEEEQGWGLFLDETPASNDNPNTAAPVEAEEDTRPCYVIKFVPEIHLLRFANEPLLLARELATLGDCVASVDASNMPSLATMKPDEAYLSWTFVLRTNSKLEAIEEVFEFVIDDCQLDISRKSVDATKPIAAKKAKEEKPATSQKPSVSIKEEPVTQALASPKPAPMPAPKLPPQTTVIKRTETKPSKFVSEGTGSAPAKTKISSIRVDLDRVDKLVNMVGELVITQAMLKQQSEDLKNDAGHIMAQGFEDLSSHTRELQESVMAIRMQPVKSVFARMPRLVRELSTKLSKKIDLVTSGEMTEVDKTVIEQLMDPLTHMIRNSVDHGVETQDQRLESGKPERATIHLSAEHRSGRIQIEVIDDGRGIDRVRVLEKALEKGVVSKDDDLLDEEIDDLIFAPGFSTAEVVSDVSGRGVGMDVVKRNILSLGGRISVFSSPGQGTRFLMSLPLTLAVLDGMVVQCGTEKYIIPLTAVMENIRPVKEELKRMVNGGVLVSVRGEYIRLVHLHRLFNVKNAIEEPSDALVVIVETERFGLVGVIVDDLLGQQQVVIKSLEENYDPIAGISAATILGNGKVALILDVDGLAEMEHGGDRRRQFGNLKQQAFLTGEQAHGVK